MTLGNFLVALAAVFLAALFLFLLLGVVPVAIYWLAAKVIRRA